MNGDNEEPSLLRGIQPPELPPDEVLAPPPAPSYERYSPSLTTFYYPETPEATRAAGLSYAMEGGTQGSGPFSGVDLRNHTLEKYQSGESPFVAVAMPGMPTGRMFTMDVNGQSIVAKNVDTGGGLRSGQVDVATSNPRLARGGGGGGGRAPRDVASFAQSYVYGRPPSAEQAALATGLGPENITHEVVNRAIQGIPQRALIAGEPTTASLEAAQEQIDAGQTSDASADYTADDLAGSADLLNGAVTADMPVPSTRGLRYQTDANGIIHYENGIEADPRTKQIRWKYGGKIFVWNDPLSRPTSFPDPEFKISKDSMGNMYHQTMKPGELVPIHPAGMIPPLRANATPDMTQAQREMLALGDLTPDQKNMVWNIAYYKAPVTATALRNPQMQYAISRASTLNPNFSAANYDAIKGMLRGYASQKPNTEGGIIRGYNQVLQHINTLTELSAKMHNSWSPAVNSVKNWLQTQQGKPYQKAYNTAAEQVANEAARAFRGSAPDQADISRQLENMGSANSPEQFDMVRKTMLDLIGGALSGYDVGWEGVMGSEMPEKRLIFPDSKRILLNMGIKNFAGRQLMPDDQGVPSATATPIAKPPVSSNAAYEAAKRILATSTDAQKRAVAQSVIDSMQSPTPTPTP